MSLTPPTTNDVRAEEIFHASYNFNLCTVTDNFVHGTSDMYGVFKCIDELLVSLHAIYHRLGSLAHNKIGLGVSTVNDRGIRINHIYGNILMSYVDIERRKL